MRKPRVKIEGEKERERGKKKMREKLEGEKETHRSREDCARRPAIPEMTLNTMCAHVT